MIKEHTNGSAASNGAASKNGAARYQSGKVRVAIVGVGNCASAFVQGVNYYKDADPSERVPGLMHVDLGGYHISRTSNSRPPSTSTRPRSARTSAKRSGPGRTTR